MIHIDPKEAERGSLSSITFTDAYGSTTDGVGGANHHNRSRTASSDLAHGSDADDEEQLQRYQLSKANAASANGRVLPPRPPLQEQTKKRKGHKRRRRQDNNAGDDDGKHAENLKVKIEFPSERDGILAPGNTPPSSLIEQGDLDCAYICTCFLLILILPILVYFYTNTSDSWRLHTGASRHVVISTTFSKSVSISRTPPTQEHGHENEVDTGGQFLVYHVDGGCPPLTGPELTLEHRRDLHLEADAYDWNRYYLNPGSVLNVTVTAKSGGVKVFLFRGKTAFESWRRDPSEYNSFFRRAHTYEGLDPAVILHEAVIAEAFYVVYSNAFQWSADVSIDVVRTLTTFNLSGVDPIPAEDCDINGTACTIPLKPWHLACIVVEAQDPPRRYHNPNETFMTKSIDEWGNVTKQSYTSDYAVAEQEGHSTLDAIVYVDVEGQHRWAAILTLALVPAILLFCVTDCGKGRDKDGDESSFERRRSIGERAGNGQAVALGEQVPLKAAGAFAAA